MCSRQVLSCLRIVFKRAWRIPDTGRTTTVSSSSGSTRRCYSAVMRRSIAAAIVTLVCVGIRGARAGVRRRGVRPGPSGGERNDSPYLYPGFGGTSLAGIGMVDVAITPRVTFGGEVSLAGNLTGAQYKPWRAAATRWSANIAIPCSPPW